MHLQENVLFHLDVGVKVTQNVAQSPLHHVTYAPARFEARFEVATSNSLGECNYKKLHYVTFDLGSRQ